MEETRKRKREWRQRKLGDVEKIRDEGIALSGSVKFWRSAVGGYKRGMERRNGGGKSCKTDVKGE